MYRRILEALADDHASGGVTARLLTGRSDRPVHDALPLRLMGAVHLEVLKGALPGLARHYPSVGGTPGADLCDEFLVALEEAEARIGQRLGHQVQTNEVGRSLVPLALVNWLGSLGVDDIDWLEIGSSAGLNLCFEHYGADTGAGVLGSADSTVWFGPDWFERAPTVCPTPPRVVRLVGTDLYPVDVHDDAQTLGLLSFFWADQIERLERTRRAVTIVREQRVKIGRASADDAVRSLIGEGLQRTTIVFHSIVWQYLGPTVQTALRAALEEAARTVRGDHRLVWARMEPAGVVADIQADVWDGRGRHSRLVLGTVGFHGRGLHWTAD